MFQGEPREVGSGGEGWEGSPGVKAFGFGFGVSGLGFRV